MLEDDRAAANLLQMLSRRSLLAAALLAPAAGLAAAEPRSLRLYQVHTGEHWDGEYHDGTDYLPDALEPLDWFLRDHHMNVSYPMDPGVYDLLWRLTAHFGRPITINIHSAFRTEETNTKLIPEGAAQNSLHKEGKAVDVTVQGFGIYALANHARAIAAGGLGLYWRARFVHLDTGPPRLWYRRR